MPSAEVASKSGNSFKHGKEMPKDILTSKLQAIRVKFRQAVDNGRRSSHGWVVMVLYEMGKKIWVGVAINLPD